MSYCHAELASEVNNQEESELVRSVETITEGELPLLQRYFRLLPLCCLSGIFLGTHFSLWIFSLRYTSLTHSLLWVAMGPIVINGGTWLFYFEGVAGISVIVVQTPSTLETLGVLLGIVGAMIMLIGIQKVGDAS